MRQRRTWVAGVAAIVAAVIVGLSTATYPAAAEPSADGPHECADATKRCDGVIEVPLDWSNPSGEKIEVAFAFVPHADQSRPAEGAILGNPGGPGAAIGEDLIFDTALGPVLDTQDLFVVDPRGTGKSTPLRCDDLDLREPQTIRDCAAEIGDRVQFFTADQVAADMNAVRQALGLPAVTFYGNSYGTLFAQAFATRFPEQTRAVFVDSVVLTDEAGYADVFASGRAIRDGLVGFEAVCEESAACRALPGDAEERWADLVAHLRDNPDPEIDVFNLIRSNAYVDDPASAREANAAAVAYLDGDPEPLRRMAAGFTPEGDGEDEFKDPLFAGSLAIGCGDSTFPFDRDASLDERRVQLDDYYESEDPFYPYLPEDMLSLAGDWPEWCAQWPLPRDSSPVPPEAIYPDVPMLAVNGQLDTTTPPSAAQTVADRFPQGQFEETPFGTHASGFGLGGPATECVRDYMREFVADPGPMPHLDCTAENYRALGSFPVVGKDLPRAESDDVHGKKLRLVSAAFATAGDSVARRNPESYTYNYGLEPEQPGLRGGTVLLPADTRDVALDAVRFVEDLTVSGDVKIADDNTVTATLTAVAADGTEHALELTWTAFEPLDATQVSGTLDGKSFEATIPVH